MVLQLILLYAETNTLRNH